MNKKQYEELKAQGWIGIMDHYLARLKDKQITEDEYHLAIDKWREVFRNEGKPVEKHQKEDVQSDVQYDIIQELVDNFGGRAKDTGINLEIIKRKNKHGFITEEVRECKGDNV